MSSEVQLYKKRMYARKRVREMKAKGLCVKCGKLPLVNKNHCDPCRIRHAAIFRKYLANKAKELTVRK